MSEVIIRHLSQPTFTVGWPLKSCTHTGIFPSVSGHPTEKRKPRKVPIYIIVSVAWTQAVPSLRGYALARHDVIVCPHTIIRNHADT